MTLKEVGAILQRLDQGDDLGNIRRAIADLIEAKLRAAGPSLGDWEKKHFATAISALGWSTVSQQQPTATALRLCLVSVEKALVPAAQRSENDVPQNSGTITFEQLLATLDAARSRP